MTRAAATPRWRGLAAAPWVWALVVLVVAHALLVATRTYQPAGDWAFIELRTRDVVSTDVPLTGAWSRYGWNHPGPLLYLALAVPWSLTGGSWRGIWFGAMVLNLLAVGVALWLAARHGRLLVATFAVAALWTVAAATPLLLSDPWNASVVVLPLVTMTAAVVGARTGDRRGVAVAAVTFVAVAQTHAGYGVLLLPAVVVVLATGWRRWRRWTLTWVGVGALLCLPALIDAIVDWPGNLWRAIDFTLTSDEPAVGFGEALRVLGRATSLSSLTGARLPSFVSIVSATPWGALPFAGLIALAAAWSLARRGGWTLWCRAGEAVALLWLGGALMTARTRGPLLIWLTTWTVALAALTWSVTAAVVLRWLLARRSVPAMVGTVAVGAVLVGLAVVNVAGSVGEPFPFQAQTAAITHFADAADDLTREPTTIDFAGDAYIGGAVQSGLIAMLEDRGRHPLGRPDQALQLGDQRVATAATASSTSSADPHLLVDVQARSATPDGATEVAVWDPLSDAERAEADALTDVLTDLLVANDRAGQVGLLATDLAPLAAIDAPDAVVARRADLERLGELHARGPRLVLFRVGG